MACANYFQARRWFCVYKTLTTCCESSSFVKFVIIELKYNSLQIDHEILDFAMNSAEITPSKQPVLELYWDATYAIVVTLIDEHPDLDPINLGLEEIATVIEQLPGFADDPSFATDRILLDIQTTWYEELHA